MKLKKQIKLIYNFILDNVAATEGVEETTDSGIESTDSAVETTEEAAETGTESIDAAEETTPFPGLVNPTFPLVSVSETGINYRNSYLQHSFSLISKLKIIFFSMAENRF